MIGSLDIKRREATVIGAGISGLLIAYELDRRGFEVTLIEEKTRAGGMIQTLRTELGLVESAAHSFLVTDEVRRVCGDLGVELVPVRTEAKARFILRRGKMRRFPLSPWETLKTMARAYFVLSEEKTSRGRSTMDQWARRHLSEAALDYLLSPFLTGIYAARPQDIAVGAAFPTLEVPPGHSLISAQLRKFRLGFLSALARSPRPGRRAMMAPRNGMGSLVEALESRLEKKLGARFRRGERISLLPDAANLILTVPAAVAGELIKPQDPVLARKLSMIRYSPLITATIFVPRSAFGGRPPRGIGVLIPESEGRQALGVLFNSSAFSDRVSDESRWVSLTMMLRQDPRAELDELIRQELHALFAFRNPGLLQDARISVTRWSHAIPQYSGQLMDVWDLARQGWCSGEGRVLFGNYTGQVSLRGMMQEVDALGFKLAAALHV